MGGLPISSPMTSQPSPTHTPLVHMPHPDSVEKNINYKPPKHGPATKTFRIQSQVDIVRITESSYSPIPSELESSQHLNYILL